MINARAQLFDEEEPSPGMFLFFLKLRHLQPLPSAGSFSLFHLPKYTSRSNTTIARLSPGCVGQIRLSERQTGF